KNILENLPIGTKVFIKNQKRQGKLQARYTGPFSVDGRTLHGNYWLINHLGKRLKHSYPVSKLKISQVESTSEDSYVVEKVLDHRKIGNKIQYLVKWQGYPDEDNTWEPESHFETIECIEEYWANKNRAV